MICYYQLPEIGRKYFSVPSSIQVVMGGGRGKGTVWAGKTQAVKAVETHSFLLLTRNILAIKTSKFQQPLYRCNLFDPN